MMLRSKTYSLGDLLRGRRETLILAADQSGKGEMFFTGVCLLVGAGCYGAATGLWRGGYMILFDAIKIPLILALTALGNALLNAMLAPLLGLNIRLRSSFMAVLLSYSITASILGAFAPLLAFLIWNMPPAMGKERDLHYAVILLVHVACIEVAGIAGNLRLFQLLSAWAPDASIAKRVMLSWLGGNFLLGTQISWILRPFIGSPELAVRFLREDALKGNFFESIGHAFQQLTH